MQLLCLVAFQPASQSSRCRFKYELGEILTGTIGSRTKITLGCLLFRIPCTATASRIYSQASELGLAIKALFEAYVEDDNMQSIHKIDQLILSVGTNDIN